MIEIKEMISKKEMKSFVTFPFKLYKDNYKWVPPLISDELESLNKDKNPVFEHSQANYFVAIKNNKIVGRIAAIINWKEVKEQEKKKMRFGWFDVEDDIEITKALISKIEEIGIKNNLKYIEGPVGFSNLDKAGLLIKGFEHLNTMITWYNFPYYKDHFENLGFKKAEEWVEYKFKVDSAKGKIEKLKKFSKLVKERYDLETIEFKSTKEIIPYVDKMFELINDSYSNLSTFVPISKKQIDYYKRKFISFISPSFIRCVANKKTGELVAFAITMPSFSRALKKAQGKRFPFGLFYIIRAQRKNKCAVFYLIGIKPELQSKGLTATLFEEIYHTFKSKGVQEVETNPELESNISVQSLWKHYSPELHKRRRSYRKSI